MKRWLRNWLLGLSSGGNAKSIAVPVEEQSASSTPQAPHCRVGMLQVMNGKVLEVCTYKRNPHGPDWTTTYWILNEEQTLAEQVATVLTMQGLAK